MPAERVHLVRHGEVENPTGVLYGRIEGFGLSRRGHRMAQLAAESLAGHDIRSVTASPLQRTQESAAPWIAQSGLELGIDERLIEPTNAFEGINMRRDLPRRPDLWRHLVNPQKPSWGEPFLSVQARMLAAIEDSWAAVDGGEVVLVSHQMPIVMVARTVAGLPLAHNPSKRRCALSSITTLERRGDAFVEVSYTEPAAALLADAIDTGAV
ncbi:histidine phosphatase family protein [Pseudolysinimonas sp.]|uniref:histidine phosphatase family protein n=1 Tax=Pseudolysinimonas sp. TaxID=2680009 RepID=UPI0037834CBC